MTSSQLYIITGASRGLGEALAARVLRPGNRVVCMARTRSAKLLRAAEDAGVQVEWLDCDLAGIAEEDAAGKLLAEWLSRGSSGGAESSLRLINNAGVLEPIGPARTYSTGALARHIAVNLTAPMALTAAFLRLTQHLQADKRVLQISSGAGRKPYAGWSAYCAAKAGLDHFTRCVHLEQAALPYGAKIVSVAPGVIDTGMQTLIREAGEERFPSHARFVHLHETGGLLAPETAAEQLLSYLEHPDFGREPVADIRDWGAAGQG